jgi:hypothetical protein
LAIYTNFFTGSGIQVTSSAADFIKNKPTIPAFQVVAELPNGAAPDTLYFIVHKNYIEMVMNGIYYTAGTPPTYSTLTIDTTLVEDSVNAFQFPIKSEIPSALTIDWGDDVIETVPEGTETGPTHTYSVPGVYRIHFESLEKSEAMANALFYETEDEEADNTYKPMILSLNSFIGVLPYNITTVGISFLAYTFYGCTSLVNAPELPQGITTVGNNFLGNTFRGCTSLVNVPAIPKSITTVGPVGFLQYTFYGCTSLVNAPELPQGITTVGKGFLAYTFFGCTSLVNAPELPQGITSTAAGFLPYTFYGCTSLVTAPAIPQGITSTTGIFLSNTFAECTALTTLLPNDESKMPWVLYTSPSSTNSFVENCINITLPVAYSDIPSLWK